MLFLKTLLIIIILLISNTLCAKLEFSRKGNIFTIKGSQKEINYFMKSLNLLNKRFNFKTESQITLNCVSSNSCSFDLSSQLPKFFEKTLSKSPEDPYCYNAPLAFMEVVEALIVTTEIEFDSYIKKFCKETLDPKPGDIGRVIHGGINKRTAHAFIYINEKTVYEKANSGKTPYQFTSIIKSLGGYIGIWEEINKEWVLKGINLNCHAIPTTNKTCETFVVYYTCKPKP